jgi:hypothetical protein
MSLHDKLVDVGSVGLRPRLDDEVEAIDIDDARQGDVIDFGTGCGRADVPPGALDELLGRRRPVRLTVTERPTNSPGPVTVDGARRGRQTSRPATTTAPPTTTATGTTTAMLTPNPGVSRNRKIPFSSSVAVPPAAAIPTPGANNSATNMADSSNRRIPTALTGRTANENRASRLHVRPTTPPAPMPGVASS